MVLHFLLLIFVHVFFDDTIATIYYRNVTIPANASFILYSDDVIFEETDGTGTHLRMQFDANLVLYNADSSAMWASVTNRTKASYYTLFKSNGNIEIKNTSQHTLWESCTVNNRATPPLSLHIDMNCAYLIDQHNTFLWRVGSGCCAIYNHPHIASNVLINDRCLPIDDISWVDTYQIAWIKVISCIEATTNFTYYYNKSFIFHELAQSVISVKIEPYCSYDEFVVTARPYSNPVYALRNNIELSYLYDPNTNTISGTAPDTSNWIGSDAAIHRLSGNCIENESPHTASDILFQACGNFAGVHILLDQLQMCYWDFENELGEDMAVYFGFELVYCDSTMYPTDFPSQYTTSIATTVPRTTEYHSQSTTKLATDEATLYTTAYTQTTMGLPSPSPTKLATDEAILDTDTTQDRYTTLDATNSIVSMNENNSKPFMNTILWIIIFAVVIIAVIVVILSLFHLLSLICLTRNLTLIHSNTEIDSGSNSDDNILVQCAGDSKKTQQNAHVSVGRVRSVSDLLDPRISKGKDNNLGNNYRNNEESEGSKDIEDMYDDNLKVKEVMTPTQSN